jgi:hypothetical protein
MPNIAPSMPKRLARSAGGGDVGHVGVGHRRIGLHGAAHHARRHQHRQMLVASAVAKKFSARPQKPSSSTGRRP